MGKQKRRDILLQQDIKDRITEEQLPHKITKVSLEDEQKKNIATVTQQTLASSEVVDANLDHQIISIESLNQLAENMKERSEDLEQAIAKFRI